MSKGTTLPPERSVAFQIRRVHLAFDRLLTMRLNRHGIKSGFWYYLRALWIEEGLTQKRLSQLTNVTEATTVSLLKDMSHKGLIRRVRDSVDRRQIFVSLMPKGRSLEPQLLPYAAELIKIAIRGISKDELSICMSVLTQVAANLEQELNVESADSRASARAERRQLTV
jgi:MarR family transcriptional regulator, organic hydroperoxide resistance regulator